MAAFLPLVPLVLVVVGCQSWEQTFGPSGSSYTSASWDASDDFVALNADRRSTESGCTTTWFDWVRSGHYDARAVRDCDAGAGESQDSFEDWSPEYSSVSAMQKLAVCTSSLEPPRVTSTSNCRKHPDSGDVETFAPFSDRLCISWRLRYSNGTEEYNSGGNKSDCNS